ncbi:hypothetical protein SAMN02745124_02979 [Desulfofustis glycolicus DSM 9705]|uniref:Uncharacterized protein n=1 Tax=Desulfofustis glycolicus DSM 9705 TaxID=1121409 RepID=A0A1M5XE70_9BACT|nr:hypothetical protein SAMN02745124_02979 [Desulfofustis glycolicus DSM 9705]
MPTELTILTTTDSSLFLFVRVIPGVTEIINSIPEEHCLYYYVKKERCWNDLTNLHHVVKVK